MFFLFLFLLSLLFLFSFLFLFFFYLLFFIYVFLFLVFIFKFYYGTSRPPEHSNGGFKRAHVESCSSTTKNRSLLLQCIWLPIWLGGILSWGLPSIKSHGPLITWSSEITWIASPLPQCISTTTVSMAIKLGRMVSYPRGLRPLMSYGSSIMCSCEVTWCIEYVVSLLVLDQWTPNMTGW